MNTFSGHRTVLDTVVVLPGECLKAERKQPAPACERRLLNELKMSGWAFCLPLRVNVAFL